jgi:hypothetical protein
MRTRACTDPHSTASASFRLKRVPRRRCPITDRSTRFHAPRGSAAIKARLDGVELLQPRTWDTSTTDFVRRGPNLANPWRRLPNPWRRLPNPARGFRIRREGFRILREPSESLKFKQLAAPRLSARPGTLQMGHELARFRSGRPIRGFASLAPDSEASACFRGAAGARPRERNHSKETP